jgi:hypothetical protein
MWLDTPAPPHTEVCWFTYPIAPVFDFGKPFPAMARIPLRGDYVSWVCVGGSVVTDANEIGRR